MILGTFLVLTGAAGLAALCVWALWTMQRQDRALHERDNLIEALNGAIAEADALTTRQANTITEQTELIRKEGWLRTLRADGREREAALGRGQGIK